MGDTSLQAPRIEWRSSETTGADYEPIPAMTGHIHGHAWYQYVTPGKHAYGCYSLKAVSDLAPRRYCGRGGYDEAGARDLAQQNVDDLWALMAQPQNA